MISSFEDQPPKTRPYPIKTRVIYDGICPPNLGFVCLGNQDLVKQKQFTVGPKNQI